MAVKVAFLDGTIEVFEGDDTVEADGFLHVRKGERLIGSVSKQVIRWVKYTES